MQSFSVVLGPCCTCTLTDGLNFCPQYCVLPRAALVFCMEAELSWMSSLRRLRGGTWSFCLAHSTCLLLCGVSGVGLSSANYQKQWVVPDSESGPRMSSLSFLVAIRLSGALPLLSLLPPLQLLMSVRLTDECRDPKCGRHLMHGVPVK